MENPQVLTEHPGAGISSEYILMMVLTLTKDFIRALKKVLRAGQSAPPLIPAYGRERQVDLCDSVNK